MILVGGGCLIAFIVVMMNRKPDPEMLIHCIQSLGSRAEQHLHLGDTPTDAAAANAAGCLFLGVRWGMDSGEG